MNLNNEGAFMKFYNETINIDTKLWIKILNDKNITNEKVINILLFLLKSKRFEASGGEIAPKLNYSHHAPLNTIIHYFGERILKTYTEINPPKRKNESVRYWHIPFLGTREKGKFTWILRNELKDALLIIYSKKNIKVKIPEDFFNETITFTEGKQKSILTTLYERNPKARGACLKHHGYKCKICGFDFEEKYGAIGKGVIHVHHINKVSGTIKEHKIDPIKELIPLCPNCHTVVHSRKEMFSIAEMKEIIKNQEIFFLKKNCNHCETNKNPVIDKEYLYV
jgi:5-methylcytosine-specific restriction protein A